MKHSEFKEWLSLSAIGELDGNRRIDPLPPERPGAGVDQFA